MTPESEGDGVILNPSASLRINSVKDLSEHEQ
jgi:hypothetical protein